MQAFKLRPQPGNQPSLNGLLGLGFPGLTGSTIKHYNPIMINMFEQHLIKSPLFSIFLNGRDEHDNYSGEIIFGGIDHDKYKGDLKYIPVVPSVNNNEYAHWAFHVNHIKLNDHVYKLNEQDVFIFDTGSSLSYIPKDIFKSILQQLKRKGKTIYYDKTTQIYAADCSFAHDKTNVIELSLPQTNGGNPITITIPFADTLITDDPILSNKNICTFGFQPMDEQSAKDSLYNGNMYVFGDTILRSLYLVFNFGEKTIGVAAANNYHGNTATVK